MIQGSGSSSKATDLTPLEFKRQRGFVAGNLNNLASGGGPQYQGPFAAGMSPDELNALTRTIGLGQSDNPFGAATPQAQQHLLNTISGQGLQGPEIQNYIQAAVRPVMQQAEDEIEGFRGAFTRAGQKTQSSSPFAGQVEKTKQKANQAIGDISAQLLNQEQNRRLQAIQQSAQTTQGQFDRAQSSLQASALPRMIEQLGIQGGLDEFKRRQVQAQQALQMLAQLTQPSIGQDSDSFAFGLGLGGGSGASTT